MCVKSFFHYIDHFNSFLCGFTQYINTLALELSYQNLARLSLRIVVKGLLGKKSVALLKQKALDNDDNNYIHGKKYKNIHTISTDCIYIHTCARL